MSEDRSTGNDEDMVNCPYDIGHRMLRKRLQQHLIRCRRNHPNAEMVKCPLNKLHIIPEPEYEIHLRYCPDRKLISQYKYEAPEQNDDFSHAPIDCEEENWDDEESVAAAEDYNPRLYAQTANIIRMPTAFRPSERKEFTKRERERRGCIESTNSVNIKQEMESNVSSSKSEEEYKVFDSNCHGGSVNRVGYGAPQSSSNGGRQNSNRAGFYYDFAPPGSSSSDGRQGRWESAGNRGYTNNQSKYAPYNNRKRN